MSLTIAEQLLPQLLGTRLDEICGRRYHRRPLRGQSLDGGAREVLLSTEGLSPGMEGRKCIPVMTIGMGLLCGLHPNRPTYRAFGWLGLSGWSYSSKANCFAEPGVPAAGDGDMDGEGEVVGDTGCGSRPLLPFSDSLPCSIPRTHLDIASNHLRSGMHALSTNSTCTYNSCPCIGNICLISWLINMK